MTNPVLLSFFAQSDEYREEILNNLKEQGWTPANPKVAGSQLNTLFFQIFAALNFQKEHGFSYYDENDIHKVGNFKRHLNKIYFCKADNDVNNKQAPVDNTDFWEVFFDLDKPIYKEFAKYSLSTHNHDATYAALAGDATKNFNVKAGTSANHAVNKQQMENAMSGIGGKVLQIKDNYLTENIGLGGSGTWYDIINCAIKPSKTSSKVRISFRLDFYFTQNRRMRFVYRVVNSAGNVVFSSNPEGLQIREMATVNYPIAEYKGFVSGEFIDNANTTNEETYTVQVLKHDNATWGMYGGEAIKGNSIILEEIGA